MFCEAYLAGPIGQLLGASWGGFVASEIPHPVLTHFHTGDGPKPRVDFGRRLHRLPGAAEPAWDLMLELKWYDKKSKYDRGRVLWDLVRLELLRNEVGCEVLFLLAGRETKLNKFFSDKHVSCAGVGGRSMLSTVVDGRRTLDLESPNSAIRTMRKGMEKKAWLADVPLPAKLTTRLRAKAISGNSRKRLHVYAWEVGVAAPRRTFTLDPGPDACDEPDGDCGEPCTAGPT